MSAPAASARVRRRRSARGGSSGARSTRCACRGSTHPGRGRRLNLFHQVLLSLAVPRNFIMSWGRADRRARSTDFNFLTVFDEQVASDRDRLLLYLSSSPTMVTLRSRPMSSTRTEPENSATAAAPLGCALRELPHARQTVSDVALGHTPEWKVRMVSWVPGSPMDWAAITPTARLTPPVGGSRARGRNRRHRLLDRVAGKVVRTRTRVTAASSRKRSTSSINNMVPA